MFSMVAATHLGEHGNSIGIEDRALGPNAQRPDLYAAISPQRLVHLETKVLRRLHYPNRVPAMGDVEGLVVQAVKKASDQITHERPGALILGSLIPDSGWSEVAGRAARNAMERIGPSKTSLSAIVVIASEGCDLIVHEGNTRRLETPMPFSVQVILNPHYFEPNPISASEGSKPSNLRLRIAGPVHDS
jgi:hypothetical protein